MTSEDLHVSLLYIHGFDKWSTALLSGAVLRNTLVKRQEARALFFFTVTIEHCSVLNTCAGIRVFCSTNNEYFTLKVQHCSSETQKHCCTVIKVLTAPELKLLRVSSAKDPDFSVDCREECHGSDQDELELLRRPEVGVWSCSRGRGRGQVEAETRIVRSIRLATPRHVRSLSITMLVVTCSSVNTCHGGGKVRGMVKS